MRAQAQEISISGYPCASWTRFCVGRTRTRWDFQASCSVVSRCVDRDPVIRVASRWWRCPIPARCSDTCLQGSTKQAPARAAIVNGRMATPCPDAMRRITPLPHFNGGSCMTARAGLSFLIPWNTACRISPPGVHSRNETSATTSGLSHTSSSSRSGVGGLRNGARTRFSCLMRISNSAICRGGGCGRTWPA
jgi:hypothetical protein